jgi:hypothetical protein
MIAPLASADRARTAADATRRDGANRALPGWARPAGRQRGGPAIARAVSAKPPARPGAAVADRDDQLAGALRAAVLARQATAGADVGQNRAGTPVTPVPWDLTGRDGDGTPLAPPALPALPGADRLSVPEGNAYLGSVWASGSQIYQLDEDRRWQFIKPDATLYNNVRDKIKVGEHFGVDLANKPPYSPHWKRTRDPRDDSQIRAQKIDQVPSANPKTTIPLFKLAVVPGGHSGHGPLNNGGGVFGGTSFVQRLNTTGGVAPAPDVIDQPGDEIPVPYTAEYHFWGQVVPPRGWL